MSLTEFSEIYQKWCDSDLDRKEFADSLGLSLELVCFVIDTARMINNYR